MKCQAIQTCLLGLEQPDQPTPELAAHLAECLVCRDWLQQLITLERHVPLLAVPPSSGKARLFEALRKVERRSVGASAGDKTQIEEEAPPATIRMPQPQEPVWVYHERRLKRLALTSALAAALVMVAVGLLVWKFTGGPVEVVRQAPAEDPLMASLLQRNLRLATASTPRQRLEALADVADDLNSEANSLLQAASPTDLATLAQLYRKVVREGIVVQAKAVPAADRASVLGPIADRLTRVGTDADEVADRLPAGTSRPLREIAAAAREGDRQLRGLLRGEKT